MHAGDGARIQGAVLNAQLVTLAALEMAAYVHWMRTCTTLQSREANWMRTCTARQDTESSWHARLLHCRAGVQPDRMHAEGRALGEDTWVPPGQDCHRAMLLCEAQAICTLPNLLA